MRVSAEQGERGRREGAGVITHNRSRRDSLSERRSKRERSWNTPYVCENIWRSQWHPLPSVGIGSGMDQRLSADLYLDENVDR